MNIQHTWGLTAIKAWLYTIKGKPGKKNYNSNSSIALSYEHLFTSKILRSGVKINLYEQVLSIGKKIAEMVPPTVLSCLPPPADTLPEKNPEIKFILA